MNALCGSFHQNLKQIEQRLAVQIHHRGHHFHVHGSLTAVTHAERLLTTLYEETLTNSDISSEMVHLMLQTSQSVVLDEVDSPQESTFPALFTRKGSIRPRGENQARYVANILRHDISFGVGPAKPPILPLLTISPIAGSCSSSSKKPLNTFTPKNTTIPQTPANKTFNTSLKVRC